MRVCSSGAADIVKAGHSVKPEVIPEVFVYFSDIVSFIQIVSDSSPVELVDFLTELWTLFDAIIVRHDVFKVINRMEC